MRYQAKIQICKIQIQIWDTVNLGTGKMVTTNAHLGNPQ